MRGRRNSGQGQRNSLSPTVAQGDRSKSTGRRNSGQGQRTDQSPSRAEDRRNQPRGRRLSGTDEFGLSRTKSVFRRKLSFMDCTLEQVQEAMASANPDFELHMDYWSVILTGDPSEDFKPLQNRTLTFWVKAFNKWLEIRKSESSNFINGCEIQEMMFISKDHLKQMASLFDPDGFRRLSHEGATNQNLQRMRVSALNLMVAGVMLSRMISSRHKFSFLFGLFDTDDSRTLNRRQFATFVKCFMSALGAVFRIPDELMPSHDEIKSVVNSLYTRIGQSASKKIQGIHAGADRSTQKAIIEAIRDRQQLSTNPMLAAASKFKKKAEEAAQQAIPYQVLLDWCYGEKAQSDPLALPYFMTIERFCPQRFGDVADEFDDLLHDFQLSYQEPVPVPEDDSSISSTALLSRAEVLFASMTFKFCQEHRRWRLPMGDVETNSQIWDIQVSKRFMATLIWAIETCASERRRPDEGHFHFDFLDVLRKLCPSALPKHLRMFDVWCQEYEALLKEREALRDIEEADRIFAQQDNLPVMPDCELDVLEKEFKKMDYQERGYVTLDDIAHEWGWSEQLARDTVEAFDSLSDGVLDKHEFFKMMCPPEYRLPEMSGFGRNVFGRLLRNETSTRRRSYEQQSKLFSGSKSDDDDGGEDAIKPAPRSVLPEVGDEMWASWIAVFDTLDKDADGRIKVQELKNSGLLSWTVAESIVQLIDPEDQHGFTREGFLQAMARAFERRIPPEKL